MLKKMPETSKKSELFLQIQFRQYISKLERAKNLSQDHEEAQADNKHGWDKAIYEKQADLVRSFTRRKR